jgi:peptidoglycan/LPS O-acetylase OafA/YrhL
LAGARSFAAKRTGSVQTVASVSDFRHSGLDPALPASGTHGAQARLRPLDGIRGIGVLLVVAAHSMPFLGGGVLGVDVFFVLSGYLITHLLLTERARTGGVDFRAFYVRRALRLGPALLVVLALVGVLAVFYVPGSAIVLHGTRRVRVPTVSVGIATLATLTYSANWVESLVGPLGYLSHTWSLAVEEQFYLFWPISLLVLSRRRRSPLAAVLALVMLAAAVRIACTVAGAPGVGNYTSSRTDQLLLGALVALLARGDHGWFEKWTQESRFGAVGLGGIVVAVVACSWAQHLGNIALLYGGYTVVGLLAAMVVAHARTGAPTLVNRALAWRPLSAVGLVSYGLYLYHVPVFLFVRHLDWPLMVRVPLEYAAAGLATALSWRFIERPALRLKDRMFARIDDAAAIVPDPAAVDPTMIDTEAIGGADVASDALPSEPV